MLNRTIITGRLTKDPVFRQVREETSNVTFTLAVPRNYKSPDGERPADFIQVTVWNALAKRCSDYLRKGAMCTVEGALRSGSYTRDGQKIYTTGVTASQVHFLGQKEDLKADRVPSAGEELLSEGFVEIDEALPF